MRPRILVSESEKFSPEAASLLGEIGDVALSDLDYQGLLDAAADADVLWVRLRHRIGAELFEAAPRLRTIVSPTTGLNHIDLDEAARRGIEVLSLRGEEEFLKDVRATAEHTIALLLALLRRLPAAVEHAAGGGWDRDRFEGRELYGKTVGIVGYGRLGRIVARYLRAFDCRVLAASRPGDAPAAEPGVELTALAPLLASAEIVSLHVNLCPETAGFFGRREFAQMRPGAWFVNTARGELIDEQALLEALESGRLSGAALDVLADERAAGMAGRPLVKYAARRTNLLLTPHVGGRTAESLAKTELFLARKLHSEQRRIVRRSA